MIERYLIAAGVIAFYAIAGWCIAHGKPAYVPKPVPEMKCEHSGCEIV